jgi:mRNA-degrading endonuclease RelE of RelBE toxin-antitoxin system
VKKDLRKLEKKIVKIFQDKLKKVHENSKKITQRLIIEFVKLEDLLKTRFSRKCSEKQINN